MTQQEDQLDVVGSLRSRADDLVSDVIDRVGPATGSSYDTPDRVASHVARLTEAIATQHPAALRSYISALATGSDAAAIQLVRELQALRRVLVEVAPQATAEVACAYLESCGDVTAPTRTTGGPRLDYDALRDRYLVTLLGDDERSCRELVHEAIDDGASTVDLHLLVFEPVLYEVGRRWETGEVSVAQEHFCTAVTESIMARLPPLEPARPWTGRRALLACVEGELHDIGLRMVAEALRRDGWDVHYLGADSPCEDLAATARRVAVDLVCLSLSTSDREEATERTIRALRSSTAERPPPVLLGGGLLRTDPRAWQRLGADGTALDAVAAAAAATALVPT